MSFTQGIIDLVTRYFKDKYGLDYDFKHEPWHKIVGYSWEANIHYGTRGYYRSLEEFADPKEGEWAYILVKPGVLHTYIWKNGEWYDNGEFTESYYKA